MLTTLKKRLKIPRPYFRLSPGDVPPSVANLPAALTINGATVYPTLRYKGGDAAAGGWAPWGYGETLALQAGTAPSYNAGSPLLGVDDDSVRLNAGGYFAGGNTLGDLATQDLVLEVLLEVSPTGSSYIPIAHFAADGSLGWYLQQGTLGGFVFAVKTASGTVVSTAGTNFATGQHLLLFACLNRNENSIDGFRLYANAAVAGTGNFAAVADSATVATPFTLGAWKAATQVLNSRVLYAAMYLQADWHQAGAAGPAEWATVAATRVAQLCGLYPALAKGTKLPTTVSRASPAYLDKVDGSIRKLYYMGAGLTRTPRRADINGVIGDGLLIEPTATNNLLESQTLQTTWAADGLTTVNPNTANGPDGTATLDGLVATAVSAAHGTRQTLTCAAVLYCFSAFVRAGAKNWCALAMEVGDINQFAWFNLSTGTVGTKGSSLATSGIEAWGGGLYRVWIARTMGAGERVCGIYAAETDASLTFTGDAVANGVHAGCCQYEAGGIPSSYMPTTTAPVARAVDSLIYNGDNWPATRGRVRVRVLREAHTPGTTQFMLSAGQAGFDRHDIVNNTSKKAQYYVYLSGVGPQVNISSAGDLPTGAWRSVATTHATNFATESLDGVMETPDTAATMPAPTTAIYVGCASNPGSEFGGLINRVEIFNK